MPFKEDAVGIANSAMQKGTGIFHDILSTLGGLMVYVKPAIVALLILIIGGWILKKLVKLLNKALEKAKVDGVFEKLGVKGEMEGMGINFSPSCLITGIITIVAKFVLWMAAINVLGIQALSDLMQDILKFIPNILVSIILIFVGMTVAKITKDLIEKSAGSLSVSKGTADLFGKIAKFTILFITAMAVLTQLGIATELVETLFKGIIATLSIAAGIAFGLGGKDRAKEIVDKLGK